MSGEPMEFFSDSDSDPDSDSDSSDEEVKGDECEGCRRTAPYYAVKLLRPDATEYEREKLVQRLRETPFFRGVIQPGNVRLSSFYPQVRGALPGGISIYGIYHWLMGAWHSLHYFILINLDETIICIDSWSDGTRWRNLEVRCWTRENAEALIALTSIQNHAIYNLIIAQLFNVILPRPFDTRRPLRIEYLSSDAIAEVIGQLGGEQTKLLIAHLKDYCDKGKNIEAFFTT